MQIGFFFLLTFIYVTIVKRNIWTEFNIHFTTVSNTTDFTYFSVLFLNRRHSSYKFKVPYILFEDYRSVSVSLHAGKLLFANIVFVVLRHVFSNLKVVKNRYSNNKFLLDKRVPCRVTIFLSNRGFSSVIVFHEKTTRPRFRSFVRNRCFIDIIVFEINRNGKLITERIVWLASTTILLLRFVQTNEFSLCNNCRVRVKTI